MDLFVVVIAILFIQVWGAENPLHKDTWFDRWIKWLQSVSGLRPSAFFAVSVLGPAFMLWLIMWLIGRESYWLLLPLSVVVLLYSFGRGEFSEIVNKYTQACREDDWQEAIERAERLDVDIQGLVANDWNTLHQHVLEEAAYRGFERMFAVLFWFFLFGPVGALVYRLIFLFNVPGVDRISAFSKRWLWLMEWPAARVLGVSFAFTGNFVGCIQRWRESLFCAQRPTAMTLGSSVLGALSVDESIDQTCEVTQKELELLTNLYRRTLWLWLAASALIVLLF